MTIKTMQDENEIICPCSGTTRKKVITLFQQGMDVEAISRYTGAISGCGGCEWDIADSIKQYQDSQNPT
jgi:NAD(P)H-nitrite reductase large subunit